jgi:hypothetical protein
MEHLNRDLKNFLSERSSNIAKQDMRNRMAKALRQLTIIRQNFGGPDSGLLRGISNEVPSTEKRKDAFKTARSLPADIFLTIGREMHPLAKKKPVLRAKTHKEEAELKTFIEQHAGYCLR